MGISVLEPSCLFGFLKRTNIGLKNQEKLKSMIMDLLPLHF